MSDPIREALRAYFRAVDDIRDAGEARMGDPTLIAKMYRDAGERKAEAETILRAALSTTPATLDAAWAEAEAALQPKEVILSIRRTADGGWEVWAGVPDPVPPDVDYGYGVGKGDGGWGPDWAEGPTPAAALLALAGNLREYAKP